MSLLSDVRFEDEEDKKRKLLQIDKLLQVRDLRIKYATEHHRNTNGQKMDFRDPYLHDIYNSLSPKMALQASVQCGKMAPLDSLVHTPKGWVTMGSLEVGDVVSTPDGNFATVTHLFPQGVQPIYEVCFSDGRCVEVGGEHLWKVRAQKRTFKPCRKGPCYVHTGEEVLSTNDIASRMDCERFSVPLILPVEKPKEDLPIDPYLLGFLLGDGYLGPRKQSFSTIDEECLEFVSDGLEALGLEYTKDTGVNYYLRNKNKDYSGNTAKFVSILRDLGLLGKGSHQRFIPPQYLRGSVEQRSALLQGLLDTDGSASKNGGITYSTTSEELALGVQELVWSLGGVCRATKRQTYQVLGKIRKPGKPSWRLVISLARPKTAFRLSRKRERLSEVHRRAYTLGPTIESIRYSRDAEAQCIMVDHPDHLYIMDHYIVTHNSEMLIIDHLAMAACGLSILFVLPKYDLRNRFVQNRINKCVERVPEYKKMLGSGFFDSIQLKYFGQGTINYVGSNVEKDFYEIPTNCAIIDEYDHCDQQNLRFVADRMSSVTNTYPFIKWAGNPKYHGEGINQKYMDSDRRVWKVPCKACGKYSELDWFKVGVDVVYDKAGNVLSYNLKDTEWEQGIFRDTHLICECGGILDRFSQKGMWVPQNPDGEYEGYLISKMFTRQARVAHIWKDFKRSIYNPSLLDWFYSSILGVPPSSSGNRVTRELLRSCAKVSEFICEGNESYIGDRSNGPCSMGIDVGTNLDVRVSKIQGKKRIAQYLGKVRTKEELYAIMENFNVECAVIDAGPELHLVDEIQASAPIPVWRCQFHAAEGKDQYTNYNGREMRITIDRTYLMDRALAHYKTKRNVIPKNFEELITGEYVEEMTASVRELVVDPRGNERYEWKKTKDHQWLADCYDLLAADFLEQGSLGDIEIL